MHLFPGEKFPFEKTMAAPIDPTPKRLYLSGIPSDQNNIQKLSEHFEQFGTISKIIINYHGNPEAALVTFASHEEANAAISSQHPVLGDPDIIVRWGLRMKSSSTPTQTSSSPSMASSSASSVSPSKDTTKITFQCEKCTKVLSTKQTLKNHMRQMHGEFHCPVCTAEFDTGNEYRKHYNAEHSDSKDFTRRSGDSKEFTRNHANMNFNFDNLTETMTSLRRENDSLKKKLKKHKKSKSKTAKDLQKRLLKLLEGKLINLNYYFCFKRTFLY